MCSVHGVALLLVDDDADVGGATARYLSRHGYQVTLARSFREACALPASCRFVVAVFDIDLGDGWGSDCAAVLLDRGQVERCVFFTGGAPQEALGAARRIGTVVMKGDFSELLAALL